MGAKPARRAFLAGGAAALGATLLPRLSHASTSVSDVATLRRAYTELHPGLHRYASPALIDRGLARLEATFVRGDSLAERYLALSRFAGLVRCGHSYANFYNQKKSVSEALFAGRNRLPFHFRWLGSRMIVTRPADGLPAGTEILSIDGRPVAHVLAALLPLARADGSNDAKRRALLSVEGLDEYESFDIYYPLLFPVGEQFELMVAPPDGRRQSLRVTPIDLASRQAGRAAPAGADNDGGWTLEHRGKASLLAMPDWALYDSKWDWRGWIAAAFSAIESRGSTGLVIDLRANEGGLDCGDAIIARLIDAPLAVGSYERRVRFRRTPEDLRPYLDTWDPSFHTLGEQAVDLGNGYLRLPGGADRTIAPAGPRFRGRVAVLVGPRNSSATFGFAEIVKRHRLAVLVGEPTGGNRRGINGDRYFFLRLPQSGLEIDLPLVGYFPKTPQPDAGILPDIAVAQTPSDIASGRDRALARALESVA